MILPPEKWYNDAKFVEPPKPVSSRPVAEGLKTIGRRQGALWGDPIVATAFRWPGGLKSHGGFGNICNVFFGGTMPSNGNEGDVMVKIVHKGSRKAVDALARKARAGRSACVMKASMA